MRLLLHPAQDLRVLPLPQDQPPGGLQLPVLLLPAVYPGQQVRRQLQVPGKRRQGLLRLPAAPRSGQLQLHQVQVPGTHGAGQEKPIRKEAGPPPDPLPTNITRGQSLFFTPPHFRMENRIFYLPFNRIPHKTNHPLFMPETI